MPLLTTPGSTYQWRYFSNDSFARIATSTAFTVSPPLQATLQAPASAGRGTTIQLTWNLIPYPSVKDWIGLYRSSNSPDGSFLAWRYTETNSPQGDMPFTIPSTVGMTTGTYELRLFANDGYFRLATRAINLT